MTKQHCDAVGKVLFARDLEDSISVRDGEGKDVLEVESCDVSEDISDATSVRVDLGTDDARDERLEVGGVELAPLEEVTFEKLRAVSC